jgi:predicted RNase H-like HicB family nuclease
LENFKEAIELYIESVDDDMIGMPGMEILEVSV